MFLFGLFMGLIAAIPQSFGDFTSWTGREKDLGTAAFPDPITEKFADLPSPELSREIEKSLSDAVDVIRIRPSAWFAAAVPSRSVSTAEMERIFKGAPGIPVRVCRQECRTCDGQAACLSAKATGDEVGTMLFIRACALGGKRCPGQKQDFQMRKFLEESLGMFAHFKLIGATQRDKAEINGKRAAEVLRSTANSVNGLLSRCPGPYDEKDFRYLTEAGHFTKPTSVMNECGESYSQAIRKKCPSFGRLEIARCDERCQALLCMKDVKAPQIRKAGGLKYLLLRPGSCEGNSPTAKDEFVKAVGCL